MKVLVNAMSSRVLGIECPSKPHVSCVEDLVLEGPRSLW